MSDDEGRQEEARIEEMIERGLKHGLLGVCPCGNVTCHKHEDPDTGEESWLCWDCKEIQVEQEAEDGLG